MDLEEIKLILTFFMEILTHPFLKDESLSISHDADKVNMRLVSNATPLCGRHPNGGIQITKVPLLLCIAMLLIIPN